MLIMTLRSDEKKKGRSHFDAAEAAPIGGHTYMTSALRGKGSPQ